MGYFYEQVLNNPDHQVVITLPGSKVIRALLVNDFSFAGNSEYSNLVEQTFEAWHARADLSKAAMLSLAGKGQAEKISKVSTRILDQTVLRWTGGGRPMFSPSLTLVDFDGSGNVLRDVKLLYSTVFPTKGSLAAGGFTTYAAPLGYVGSARNEVYGTLSLKIGNWFEAVNVLVATSVSFTYSKETTPKGTPLFATGEIQLESYRLMTYDEIEKFFKR